MTNAGAPNPKPSSISPWRATLDALRNRPFAHFPRVRNADGSWSSLDDKDAIGRAAEALKDLDPTPEELDEAFDRARETLDEVKGITDYQDRKATRLLTIITFLSALSGVLFGRLVDAYPLHSALGRAGAAWWHALLLLAAYLGFAAFALLAACGALVTFHAIRARFRYPETPQPGRAKSFLFYRSILEVPPAEWANSFIAAEDKKKLAPDLKLKYFRNYVVESYLVAAKVADKMRYLEPAQVMQSWAIRVLVGWLIVFAVTLSTISPVEESSNMQPASAPASPAAAAPAAPQPRGERTDGGQTGEPGGDPLTAPTGRAAPPAAAQPRN